MLFDYHFYSMIFSFQFIKPTNNCCLQNFVSITNMLTIFINNEYQNLTLHYVTKAITNVILNHTAIQLIAEYYHYHNINSVLFYTVVKNEYLSHYEQFCSSPSSPNAPGVYFIINVIYFKQKMLMIHHIVTINGHFIQTVVNIDI